MQGCTLRHCSKSRTCNEFLFINEKKNVSLNIIKAPRRGVIDFRFFLSWFHEGTFKHASWISSQPTIVSHASQQTEKIRRLAHRRLPNMELRTDVFTVQIPTYERLFQLLLFLLCSENKRFTGARQF
ncbi:hypothetical protein TNCV_1035881 [Trichonephila clavipes]|nr:hypothetical protein TNCV_1035881 [Trichonephila clavipes]